MRSHRLHFCLALFVALALWTQTSAQDKDKPKQAAPPAAAKNADKGEDDYRQLFKKPTNAAEYWNALQFELDVGKFDLAAAHLRGLLAYQPSDDELVKLADQVGIASFLRLRNVQKWSD